MQLRANFGARLPVSGPLASPENIIAIGDLADELGFDAVTAHDHVSFTEEQKYHNSGGTAELIGERESKGLSVTDLYETMSSFSVVAGRTSKVRLVPTAAVLTWRHPVLFAKQAVTLHELSGGRFVCTVVIGNIMSDFMAMNVDFAQRGKIYDEYLEVLRLAFSRASGSFRGKFIDFSNADFRPRPSTKIPIWMGGSFTDRVFNRIAKFGDGFLTSGGPATYAKEMQKLNKILGDHRRRLSELEIGTSTFLCMAGDKGEAERRAHRTVESFFEGEEWANQDLEKVSSAMHDALVGTPDDVIRKIELYLAAGVSFFDLRFVNSSLEEVLDSMKLFAKEVMSTFGGPHQSVSSPGRVPEVK